MSRQRKSVVFWIIAAAVVLPLPGSLWRMVTMPPVAEEPLPTPVATTVAAPDTAPLKRLGGVKLDAILRTTATSQSVYSPGGSTFTTSPLREPLMQDARTIAKHYPYFVQASIQADKSRIFNARLGAVEGEDSISGVTSSTRYIAVPEKNTGLGTFVLPNGKDLSVRVGVARTDEVRTIAETPLWNPFLERVGGDLHVTTKMGVHGFTGATGFTAYFQMPPALMSRVRANTVAVKVQVLDWLGNARYVPLRYQPTGEASATIFDNIPAAIRSLRIVAAPIHWAVFRGIPTGPNHYSTIAPTVFPVTASAMDMASSYIPSRNSLVIAQTNRFIPREETSPASDAIVVAEGGNESGSFKQADDAYFTVHLPAKLVDKAKLVAVITVAKGRAYESQQYQYYKSDEAATVIYRFPQVNKQDVTSFSLQMRR